MTTMIKSKLNKALSFIAPLAALALPVVVSAQIDIPTDVGGLQGSFEGIFNLISGILLVIILIYLIWGAFVFATAGGDEDKRKKGRDILLYGLIGIFLLVSIFGLINFVIDSIVFEGDTGTVPDAPEL